MMGKVKAPQFTQPSLFDLDEPAQPQCKLAPTYIQVPQEEYERRRVAEMAEKLHWPEVAIAPTKVWPGVKIEAGEEAWRAFLAEERDDLSISLVLLDLHKRLNPLYHGCIDNKTGLCVYKVEVISQVEERSRARIQQIAEYLEWPRIAYWDACEVRVIGPGEEVWRRCLEYGCSGLIVGTEAALERRLRGEPDRIKPIRRQAYDEDND